MFGIDFTNLQGISIVVIAITLLVLSFTLWREIKTARDPRSKIPKIDEMVGNQCCSRLVQNLIALDRFYSNRMATANYAEIQIYRTLMDQVEEDAMRIACAPERARQWFYRLLRSMGHDVLIYQKDDGGDPIGFEITNGAYSIKCSYG